MITLDLSSFLNFKQCNSIQNLEAIGKSIIIATHPRSGTHLTIDLLRKQFQECQAWLWYGETLHNAYLNLDRLSLSNNQKITCNQAINILKRASRPIIKTHSLPDFNELGQGNADFVQHLITNSHIIYVVRDGRSVMCSTHLWLQKYHPHTRCSFSEFLRQEVNGMSRPKYWSYHVRQWHEQNKVKPIKFENIIKNTYEIISIIAQLIEIEPILKTPLLPTRKASDNRWKHYWSRLSRNFESTTIAGRYQSKKPEPWSNNFNQEDRIFFHQETNGLLLELGYELSNDWLDN